ncbi:MAG: helix-turn-helix transcriptional regulator [Rhizobiales bacterium]|nr:helix-turn-helix transcriptional regulator [Hyphomicrobiales bacterium]
MTNKDPHPIDRHVGGRVRLQRTLVGMSQEQLGDKLGVTFQQVQKYEKGSNRISASRLWQISRILGTPVSFFFDLSPDIADPQLEGLAEAGQSEIGDMTHSTESLTLLRHFTQISDPTTRRAVIDLARSLAAANPADHDLESDGHS